MPLLLIRHAEAVLHAIDDVSRPLTDHGIQQAHKQAGLVASFVPSGCLILHSPYRRAVQTATIIANQCKGHRVEDASLSANRPVESVLQTLQAHSDLDLIAVGHLPSIAEVIAHLTGARKDAYAFPPCTVAVLNRISRQTGLYELTALIPPRLALP
jgi:phosphohistidine phosphatase